MEFKLICEPSEIENFRLYGSPDDTNWTEILHQSTSANITSTGTNFNITNPGSYQHYGLVVTKNKGYHNVSIGEVKLVVGYNLSNYYTKPEVNSLIPKGVRAEGTFRYTSNNSAAWYPAQATFFANSSNVSFDSGFTALQTSNWGNLSYWSYAPNCTVLQYRFSFTSPILDDTGEATSEYKVMLQEKTTLMVNSSKIIGLEILEPKYANYFQVVVYLQRNATNNYIIDHEFDFVVF